MAYNDDCGSDCVSPQINFNLGTSSLPLGGGDTDQDGLNDFLETVGAGALSLPWEGSNPIVKDIFVEVDYMSVDPSYPAPEYLDYFPDMIDYFTQSQSLNFINELKYSFSHHGLSRIHILTDDQIPFHKNLNCGEETLGDDPVNTDQLASYFTSERAGIYRWAVFGDTIQLEDSEIKGAQCGNGSIIIGMGRPSSLRGNQNIAVFLHELGHDLSLSHRNNDIGGGSYCEPNSGIHRSVMNYRCTYWGEVPQIYSTDSKFRYSTDEAGTYINPQNPLYLELYGEYGTDWTMVWNSSGLGCVNPTSASPKWDCIDEPSNSFCDCTQNDYTSGNLDYSGGGFVMNMAMMSIIEEEIQLKNENEKEEFFKYRAPIVGIHGKVIANNLHELIESGKNYNKFDNKVMEKKKKDIKEIFGEKIVYKYNELLKTEMFKRGIKEGRDFEINGKNGEIEFSGYEYGYKSEE